MPASEKTRKIRDKPAPYTRQKPKAKAKDVAKTSAQSLNPKKRENLTLNDWMTVLLFMDKHPHLSQGDIVKHFKTKADGALFFDQSTLSRKVKARAELKSRVLSHPSALSSKRPRIVTRPDVERVLVLWVRSMEEKHETVTGPMLRAKRERVEEMLKVPESERLPGDGWIASFCRAHCLKEFRRHGEAGSVDMEDVEAERKRMQEILKPFALRDRWNFDETSLFPKAPPDRGLASKQMSGKKKDKFRITLGFACNADGSEKLPPIYIGKSKQPRCFAKKKPESYGFYYRNNKKAWMTGVIFEEYIKKLDMKMRSEGRHILLSIDNFSAHYINYEPSNVQIEYFKPNLTSFVQPLDAGIIRCFKAHYRKQFCLRALDLDEAGERDIYKIDLLEGMKMANIAWEAVGKETIEHCWNHTKIQPNPISTSVVAEVPVKNPEGTCHSSRDDTAAWDILRKFATDSAMTLPQAEDQLQAHLGSRYGDGDWQPVLKAVMDAEGDVSAAEAAVEDFLAQYSRPRLTIKLPARPLQIDRVEGELMDAVSRLKARNRIFGPPLTADDIVDPDYERADPESDDSFQFPGGLPEIVAHVQHELKVQRGEVIEIEDDSDSDGEDDEDAGITHSDVIKLTQTLERLSIKFGGQSLDLAHHLRRFRATLRFEELSKSKQPTISSFFQAKD